MSQFAADAAKTGHQTAKSRLRCVGGKIKKLYMSLGTILLVLFVLMVLGALPTWPHSRNWGYAPSSGLGLILVILLVLLLLGRI